jgi:putative transposase
MKAARVVVFGMASFTRASIPDILADFENMPDVDGSALDEDDKPEYKNNLEAVRLFIQEPAVTLLKIREATGVYPNQLYLLLSRMVERDFDGRIRGKRGLIPRKHYAEYVRKAAVQPRSVLKSSSAAGAMDQLLREHPEVLKWMKKVALQRKKKLKPGEIRAVRKPLAELHAQWLEHCTKAGRTIDQWPHNQDLRGFRSFQDRLAKFALGVDAEPGDPSEDAPAPAADFKPKPAFWPAALRPFMIVQFDGHKIDIRITLRIPDPFGMDTIYEIHRIWILVISDVQTKAILGYYLALGLEYNKDDFAEAIQAAIVPHRPIPLTIPDLKVRESGGFPTQLQPELAYHYWQFLQYDEAKCHLALSSLERVTETLGTWTIAGRLGEPNDRAYEERLFGLLETSGFHQIPGTLGSSPDDPVRELGDVGNDLTRLMTLDELEQVAYVLVANLNGEPQAGLGGRTALEAMRYLTSKDSFLPQLLPSTRRHQLFLLKESIERTIVGGKSPPHINFENVRYSSDVLERHPELKGQVLRIYYSARDLRQVHAYFKSGPELGILTAERQWRTSPHSLRLRKEIFRLLAMRKIKLTAQDDPVEVYTRYKIQLAKQSKKAAGALAKVRETLRTSEQAAAHGDSPFEPTTRPAGPGHGVQDVMDKPLPPTRDQAARPKPTPVPAPVTLTRTLYF